MSSSSRTIGNLFDLIKTEDIPYEEDVLRNPLQVKSWIRYYEFKENASHKERVFILSRAVKELPRSYKLWKMLLELLMDRLFTSEAGQDLMRQVNEEFPSNHSEWALINGYFEQCIILCNRFPRIWYYFCQFLMHQPTRTTYTRRTFDRALRALPVTQHKDIWELYTKFAANAGGETTIRVWRRFVRMQPTHAERFCNILLELNPPRTAEAARVLTAILESPEKYANPMGKTNFEYWSLLCKIIVEHPEGIQVPQEDHLVPSHEFAMVQRTDSLDVEKILRTGLKMFKDQVGVLWNSLARWFILQGDFDRAQAIYEEAMRHVRTVKDFSLVFDAYAQMEETVLNDAMEKLGIFEGKELPEGYLDETDVDLRLARFESLMDRRPFLANEVLLRQNPHNVNEWKARANLYLESKNDQIVMETYTKAVEAINPFQSIGNVKEIWVEFAQYFNGRKMVKEAREVFEKAVIAKYLHVDDLAYVWCQWAEMEIQNGNYQYARDLIGRATAPTSGKLGIRYDDDTKSPQQRLFKCIRLWSFYADLEESTGTVESARAVYDRILELKIATPQIIINYATFLEENNFYEEVFKVDARVSGHMSVG